jgi:hypothetical protein
MASYFHGIRKSTTRVRKFANQFTRSSFRDCSGRMTARALRKRIYTTYMYRFLPPPLYHRIMHLGSPAKRMRGTPPSHDLAALLSNPEERKKRKEKKEEKKIEEASAQNLLSSAHRGSTWDAHLLSSCSAAPASRWSRCGSHGGVSLSVCGRSDNPPLTNRDNGESVIFGLRSRPCQNVHLLGGILLLFRSWTRSYSVLGWPVSPLSCEETEKRKKKKEKIGVGQVNILTTWAASKPGRHSRSRHPPTTQQ